MLERLNPILLWRNLSKEGRRALFVGLLLGILLMIPILTLDDNLSRPMLYDVTVVEDKIEYNKLYYDYCDEVGNATDFDRVIVISPLIDNSTYRNVAVTVINFSNEIFIRYICFVDVDNNVIESIKNPDTDQAYSIEGADYLNLIVIFLYSTVQYYAIEILVW